ncbi:MAG: FAD-dependent oxidoreductase [Microgenomates group bacterium]
MSIRSIYKYILTVFLLILLPLSVYFFIYPIAIKKSDASSQSYDVIVVGAGTGGVSAAIQAARLGSNVLLVEKTDWIGGQMTSYGVSTMDGGDPVWTAGIYKEFIDKVKAYYSARNKSVYTSGWDYNAIHFEPSVGHSILKQMVSSESKINLMTNANLTNLIKEGSLIKGVVVNGQEYLAKVVIDATEYGDVLRLSGAEYRAGNSVSNALNPSACIQDITYPAIIKKYPNGVPADLIMTQAPPGYSSIKAMYASNLSATNWVRFIGYRGLPDSSNPTSYDGKNSPQNISKTALNWFNDYPADVRYLTDLEYRKSINCEAKLRTLQLVYFIQKDLGMKTWSIANDEGYDTQFNISNSCPNIPQEFKKFEYLMPQGPYVRESLRAIGMETLVAKMVDNRSPLSGSSNSIAVGTYVMDLHRCNTDANLEPSLEKKSDDTRRSGPFTVPFGTLIPQTVDGLVLAEKNISVSRLANGAIRLQPITMLTGQAAGVLANIASSKNIQPRNVDVREVQDKLIVNGNSMLYPYSDAIGHKYFNSIQKISVRGIITANDNFLSNSSTTRDQLAMAIVKAFNLPITIPVKPSFSDVPATNPYYVYIETIYKNGLTAGCAGSTLQYCPTSAVTNGQIPVLLLRAWSKSDPSIVPYLPTVLTYSDLLNHYSRSFAESLAAKGAVFYCDSNTRKYCPESISTKAYLAAFIDKIISLKVSATPTPIPTSVPIATLSPTPSPITVPTTVSTSSPIAGTTTPIPTNAPTLTPIPQQTPLPACMNMYYCYTVEKTCRLTSSKYSSQTQDSCEVAGQTCSGNLNYYLSGKTTGKCFTSLSVCQSSCK